MDILLGIILLVAFLVIFSLFTFYAPEGASAMGAMADAAVASFLVEAVFGALFGEIFGIAWLTEIGLIAGGMSGVAAAILVALALGVSPVYAVMIGLTGQPMAIAGLAIFGTAACNYIFFRRLNIGDQADAIAVTVEPLTAADLVSANPIPVFSTNFISGGLIGIMIALSGMINNSPGTASVVPGIIAAYAWNPPLQVTIYAVLALIIGAAAGLGCAWLFRNYPIINREDLLKRSAERTA